MIKFLMPVIALGAAAAMSTAAFAQSVGGVTGAQVDRAAGGVVGGVTVYGSPPVDLQLKSKPVLYRDLDLSSEDGARTLFHRIRNAAAEVCDPRPAHLDNLRDYRSYQDFAQCEIDGINLAVAEVNSPVLSQYVDGIR